MSGREGSPRADRAWPPAWPSPSGPQGRQRSPRARVGPEDPFCGAGFAERLERIFGCPCAWRGRPGQCAAVRPCACDPFARRLARLARDDRPGQFIPCGTCSVRYGGVRGAAGAGHRCGGQRPAPMRFRARGSGPGCPATCGESPRYSLPPRRDSPQLVQRPFVHVSRTLRAWLGRSTWRAEGAPLKP
jgi:hypothetical protein